MDNRTALILIVAALLLAPLAAFLTARLMSRHTLTVIAEQNALQTALDQQRRAADEESARQARREAAHEERYRLAQQAAKERHREKSAAYEQALILIRRAILTEWSPFSILDADETRRQTRALVSDLDDAVIRLSLKAPQEITLKAEEVAAFAKFRCALAVGGSATHGLDADSTHEELIVLYDQFLALARQDLGLPAPGEKRTAYEA